MKRLKIAVVGSGISGLGAAWLLSKSHDVSLFEATSHWGGHSFTFDAKQADKKPVPVDCGFIIYNNRTYPNLSALFDHLDVPTAKSNMGFSVSMRNGAYEYSGAGLFSLMGSTRNLTSQSHWRMMQGLVKFFKLANSDFAGINENLSLGVVTAIAGATRLRAQVTGLAGHAGTVPMGQRQDALTAASEMVLFVERYCSEHKDESGLVGTVGIIEAKPGAANVIPQDVSFTIDVRSGGDAARRRAVASLRAQFSAIAARRNVTIELNAFYDADAAPCDTALQAQLARAIERQGLPVRHLPSGAGHDAMVFPAVCPTAMLFVRCGNNGISHHPDETMTAEDAELATQVLLDFFEHFNPPEPHP